MLAYKQKLSQTIKYMKFSNERRDASIDLSFSGEKKFGGKAQCIQKKLSEKP